jgi:hypothetical protein
VSNNWRSVRNVDIQGFGVDDLAQYSIDGCPGLAVVIMILLPASVPSAVGFLLAR